MTAPPLALFIGVEGYDLTADEIALLREANPYGLFLFRRNIDTANQVRRLCAQIREALGRPDAPIFIDQEGGRVQRLNNGNFPNFRSLGSFGALARKYSQDPGSARRGGDLGFHARGRMVAAFEEAEFALQPGQLSDVVETQFGYHVIKVEAVREGDVPEDEAKNEVAERLLRESRGAERARDAATTALARLKAGESLEAIAASVLGVISDECRSLIPAKYRRRPS